MDDFGEVGPNVGTKPQYERSAALRCVDFNAEEKDNEENDEDDQVHNHLSSDLAYHVLSLLCHRNNKRPRSVKILVLAIILHSLIIMHSHASINKLID